MLIPFDYCQRIIRYEDGTHEWLKIPRHRCNNSKCNRLHRMLPDLLTPFKHYSEETISGVLDDVVQTDDADSEDYPSEMTMKRWHHWLMFNRLNIDGTIRSVAHRTLDFSEELLKSSVSLLDSLRQSIPDGWLRLILRYIYNSGNALTSYY